MAKDFMTDPLWYKDAVIYELHVRSFFDASNDGFGDFAGLRKKLPYLERLGVNCLWLLPFLKSPLRDDGYDTADYYNILPVHGSIDDFQAFLDEAHARGMRVITELVLNHTSDQHPWFQEARDPSSDKHDWYVWSETTEKYKETRIIFTDTEISNWTWDQKAGKYFWHRFFSHQPDLNFDNPDVRETMKEVMFYWLDMGVDGLRLDAVPYLYEREGTTCENLPETIDYIVELRQAIEERYGPGKVLLAEANQWPEDTLPYFADGRGVQMAFNFPIMPRMYMALRRENRRPLVEMLQLTEDIPEDAQWAIFLRNHDELTLEMVTDEERDYMYHEYATDSRFRINVGIRRRLAPLLGGDRRRIELMNALLLSLKGSPILYYGDEIGMGDDPFLGDRNGVRTPMQWSPDKNGGFSRAPHHQLFMPAISRGAYSYEFINVEDADSDPHSLLNLTRRMLGLRRQHQQTFGRGSFDIIPVENQRVLAFVREYKGERILVVANLSRFAQSVTIPVTDEYRGLVPVELFSQGAFPPLDSDSYHLVLAPHGFFWFSLEPAENLVRKRSDDQTSIPADANGRELEVLEVPEGLENVLVRTLVHERGMERLEELLPSFLGKQRWFGSTEQNISSVRVNDAVRLQANPRPVYLSILEVEVNGKDELYVLPLTLCNGEDAQALMQAHPRAAAAWLETPQGRSLVYDATVDPEFWLTLLSWWQKGAKGRSLKGLYVPELDASLRKRQASEARLLSGEQSNSAAIIDGDLFIKLYRRVEQGINPETELLDYMTRAGFQFVPRLHGTLSYSRAASPYVLGIVQQALDVEEDGWGHALNIIDQFLDRVEDLAPPEPQPSGDGIGAVPAQLEDLAPEVILLARVLGIRTGEMHLALSRSEDEDIKPRKSGREEAKKLINRIRHEAAETRRLLTKETDFGSSVLEANLWDRGVRRLAELEDVDAPRKRIRIHGDYHLGQVVLSDGEFYILDFEGEPARSIDERRERDHALRDVAGMLRSLEYAALSTWKERDNASEDLRTWIDHLVRWSESAFLNAYFSTAEDGDFLLPRQVRRPFLWAYLLDKALYEIRYEINHRPSWVWLPLEGLKRLLEEADRFDVEPADDGDLDEFEADETTSTQT
jgi:maltose alpha-D-glucosyltransferase / alpha-amylase